MEIEKLIDKFEEIKQILEDVPEIDLHTDSLLEKAYQICENVIIDYKVEKRLNDETRA